MKKYIYSLFLAIVPFMALALDDDFTIVENFQNNRLQWDEIIYKDYSTMVKGDCLELMNKNEDTYFVTVTDFPIDFEEDFDIKFIFRKPKIDDKHYFGVIFNYIDEDNFNAFVVKEGYAELLTIKEGKQHVIRRSTIILKKGNKNNVEMEIEKKGSKLVLSVDNMEFKSLRFPILSEAFGFIIYGKQTINVDEIQIKQYLK